MSSDDFLAHFGVKGMRWGVRKDRESSTSSHTNPKVGNEGVRIGRDGSIDIAAGANLQRLVRSNGQSLPMKDLTYASITEYDNARYIKVIGGKGFFGGGRDQILTIQATKSIKAPSLDEATRIHSELMLKDADFRKKNTNMLGASISDKELAQIKTDPQGKTARAWYEQANQKLTFDATFDPEAPFIQKKMRENYTAKGYNALRDENDVNSKIAKSPVIIFNPQDSLRVVRTSQITDEVRKANKQKLKVYKSLGKDWLEKELYAPKPVPERAH